MHNKGWVALVMAVIGLVEQWSGWSPGVDKEWVTSLIFVLSPIAVWLVPNRGS